MRNWSTGRRIFHLACHGLADQKHGNFFGALALTPGPKGSDNPADDGFLTLPGDLRAELEGLRAGDPVGLPDELRPAAEG